jgi:hypothetical protein
MAQLAKEPCCKSCGVPWVKHNGIQGACSELIVTRAVADQLRKELMDAQWFKLMVGVLVLKDGVDVTVENILQELVRRNST